MSGTPAAAPGRPPSYGPATDAVLAALRAAVAADALEAWVVGGAVRERLRGRPSDDVDVAVAGDGDAVRRVARAVARSAGGHAFPLSDAFGAWRATSRPAETPVWQLDLTPLQGRDLAEDLGRRDLTVNALAEPVGVGEPVDLFDGRADLAASRLRLVAPDALERDPVRVVRLARFAAELGARPVDEALRAARAAAAGLPGVPGERTLPELLRALTGTGWARGVDALEATGALAALLPASVDGDGALRPATRRVLGTVLDAPAVPEAGPDDAEALRRRASATRSRELLALSALLLPATDAGEALDGLRPSRDLRTGVGRATAAARRILALPRAEEDPGALFAALGPAGTDAPEAVLLARAASGPEAVDLPWRALAARAVRWAAGPPRPPLSGDALAGELGMRPGPELGRLLRELAIAHDAGLVPDPRDAVRLARALRDRDAERDPSGG